jgi:uncharacterized membrane protein
MDRAVAFLAGAGLGAGMMFLLDPQMGRRRRAWARDKATRLGHEVQDAAEVVSTDATNRLKGLASGDLSVLVGGKRALKNPLSGHWSPTGRALLGLVGGGLVLYGLTQEAPEACILGTVGLALAAEAATNASFGDLARVPQQVAGMASEAAGKVAETVGLS